MSGPPFKDSMSSEELMDWLIQDQKARIARLWPQDPGRAGGVSDGDGGARQGARRMRIYNLRVDQETLDALDELAFREQLLPSAVARMVLRNGIYERLERVERMEKSMGEKEVLCALEILKEAASALESVLLERRRGGREP